MAPSEGGPGLGKDTGLSQGLETFARSSGLGSHALLLKVT